MAKKSGKTESKKVVGRKKSSVNIVKVPSKLEELMQRVDATLDLVQLRLGELSERVEGVGMSTHDIWNALKTKESPDQIVLGDIKKQK